MVSIAACCVQKQKPTERQPDSVKRGCGLSSSSKGKEKTNHFCFCLTFTPGLTLPSSFCIILGMQIFQLSTKEIKQKQKCPRKNKGVAAALVLGVAQEIVQKCRSCFQTIPSQSHCETFVQYILASLCQAIGIFLHVFVLFQKWVKLTKQKLWIMENKR